MPTPYPIRRRPRECKTCLPCRNSKVRCDRNVPCSNCVKRNFKCTYGRPPPPPPSHPKPPLFPDPFASTSSSGIPAAPQYGAAYPVAPSREMPPYGTESSVDDIGNRDSSSDTVDLTQIEWDEINLKMRTMEELLSSLQTLFRSHASRKPTETRSDESTMEEEASPASRGVYGSNSLKTGSVHIGSRSALVDILDKSKGDEGTAQALPKEDLITELALGNESVAYPFADLWSSDPLNFNIAGVCGLLPDDEQCKKFLDFYINLAAVLYPVLPDLSKLERDMNKLLRGRQASGGVFREEDTQFMRPFGKSLTFLSLCFAVLASGCQLSDLKSSERRMTSWVYVSCAYQCLRMINYVSQPSVEVIQILLIISNVLSYNMNASASYTLLGMTERMCMVLGLHVESPGFPLPVKAARRRVWWAMAFQNSHFSLAYDRPSITMVSQPDIPFDPKSMPGHRSYFETLCRVISVALDMLRRLMLTHHSHLRPSEIREYKQQIERVISEAAPHLRFREHCHTLANNIERTELRLHSSYYISLMCRVSLDPDARLDDYHRSIIREDCLTNLISTIEAFIELHSISTHCSRTWISLQRTIASAFLLVANNNIQLHPQVWDLIQKLEMVLADHVYANGEEVHNSQTDSAKHLASSLRALREVSAAFRARDEKGKSAPETVNVTPNYPVATGFPSPASVPPTHGPAPPYLPDYAVALGGGHLDNILTRVSDVMLFPSMSMGNA